MAGTGRNLQLDGLRGYAAVAVVFFHTILGIAPSLYEGAFRAPVRALADGYGWAAKIALTVFNGHAAVSIFFVLSGAVLMESLTRSSDRPAALILKFTIRRFFRIYPPLLVCLVACFFVFWAAGVSRTAAQLWTNALLLDFPINGATWSMQAEFLAIPAILAAFYAFRQVRELGIILVGVAVWLLLKWPPAAGPLFYFSSVYMSLFLGLLIPTPLGSFIAHRLPSWSWPVWLILCFAAGPFAPKAGNVLQHLGAGALTLLLYYGRTESLGRFLGWPSSIYLGRISYSFYLFNVMLLEVIVFNLVTYTDAAARPLEYGTVAGLVIVLMTMPIASLSERFVERPSIALGRMVSGWIGARPARPAPAVTEPVDQRQVAAGV